MTLNASGPISLGGATVGQSINLELGVSATAQASINSSAFRTLAGVPSGAISLNNFYGKSTASTGFFAGGLTSFAWTTINATVIASTGTFTTFGQLTTGRYTPYNASSATRGVIAGGSNTDNTALSSMDYITFATAANAVNFGNLASTLNNGASIGNTTRGVFATGWANSAETIAGTIQYVTIATTGNATTFGSCTGQRNVTGVSNSTYGIFLGGFSGVTTTACQYITIASTGDASFWGSLSASAATYGGLSSSTRGVFISDTFSPNMQYITISTSGTNTSFGNMGGVAFLAGGMSNSVIGLWGTYSDPQKTITIASTGDATNYGNLGADARSYGTGLSPLGGA